MGRGSAVKRRACNCGHSYFQHQEHFFHFYEQKQEIHEQRTVGKQRHLLFTRVIAGHAGKYTHERKKEKMWQKRKKKECRMSRV